MTSFKRQNVQVSIGHDINDAHAQTVLAYVAPSVPGLCVHREVAHGKSVNWTVTHVDSGFAVQTGFDYLKQAKTFVVEISHLADWRVCRSKLKTKTKGFGKRIREIKSQVMGTVDVMSYTNAMGPRRNCNAGGPFTTHPSPTTRGITIAAFGTTLVPANGRDYKTAGSAIADFHDNKDFIIADGFNQWDGKPASKSDLANSHAVIRIRYCNLTKTVNVSTKEFTKV